GEESVKRRKFATAGALLVTLLVAALAAASVSAAASAPKTATATGSKLAGKLSKVGTGQFKPTAPHQSKFINSPTPANANSILKHDRGIPGKHGPNSGPVGNSSSGSSAAQAPFIPHAHSLPITSAGYAGSTPALNAFSQDTFGAGYIDTP